MKLPMFIKNNANISILPDDGSSIILMISSIMPAAAISICTAVKTVFFIMVLLCICLWQVFGVRSQDFFVRAMKRRFAARSLGANVLVSREPSTSEPSDIPTKSPSIKSNTGDVPIIPR